MEDLETYQQYAQAALKNFEKRDEARRNLLFDAVKDLEIERVLDVGCGAGQELFPFIKNSKAFCVGVDVADGLGKVAGELFFKRGLDHRAGFSRSLGEVLPFADESFDVVLCRVALPYMNNRKAIAEIARVLRPNGVFLLKIHAPPFYFGMIKTRLKTLDPKQIAYPTICLAGGTFHWLTGKQPQTGLWKGKEVFQTRGFLRKEFAKVGLRIERELTDTNIQTPSFVIVKREV